MTISHYVNKEVFETIRERLDSTKAVKSTKQSFMFLFNCGPVSEIILKKTDLSKPTHTYIIQTALDSVEALSEMDFYLWVTGLYQELFTVTSIEDFPAYDQWICDYAVYEQTIPVEDADKTIGKLLKTEKWLPEQLDRDLWDNHKLKNGYAWYAAKEDKIRFTLQFHCNGSLLKKKCRNSEYIRAHGITLAFALDSHTEDILLQWGKEEIYKTNRILRSPYKPDDILRVLIGNEKIAAETFITLAEKHDLKPEITYKPAQKHWKCVYFLRKPKQKIFTLWASPEEFRIKANLFKIDEYIADCYLTDTVKRQFLENTGECGDCADQRCIGAKITLDGHTYRRCIYGAFEFFNLASTDCDVIAGLVEKEISNAKSKLQ